MRPRERRDSGEQDLFRSRLDQIIAMSHPLVRLAQAINWRFLEEQFGAVYTDGAGRPPLPMRLMAGLAILKHTYNLSDEAVCALWIENPYYQYFCGEEFFQHELPLDRSSMTNWRNRMGEERLQALLQESLAVATRTGAMKPSDLARIIVDTTVQPKNITFPTDAKLVNRAREKLVKLAKRLGVVLRQSYARVGKIELIKHQRYAHAASSTAPTGLSASSRPISAASSATSNARSQMMTFSRPRSRGRSTLPAGCANRNAGNAAPRSTACTHPRSNASARASHTSLMSLASR
jgi:transposase, IS5 family